MKEIYTNILLNVPINLSRPIVSVWRLFKYKHKNSEATIFYKNYFKKITIDNRNFNILLSHKNGTVDNHIHKYGVWDEAVLTIVKQYLKEDSVFIDVGSNIGFFSLYASTICKKVIAFEPIDFVCKQFLLSIKQNNIQNIDLRKKACGEENSNMKIHLVSQNIGASGLVRVKDESYKSIMVSVRTLDSEIYNEQVDLIKIDVEGFEPEVFNGAKKVIKKYKPIIVFEFSPTLYERRKKGMSIELLNSVESFGYDIYDTIRKIKVNNSKYLIKYLLMKSTQTDLLCIPHGNVYK